MSALVLFANLVSVLAGLGSVLCYILVLVHLFQSDQKGLGIVCILLTFLCGIGALLAFIKGWIDGINYVMWVWTGCIAIGLLAAFFQVAGG
jgi:hypothetical protein